MSGKKYEKYVIKAPMRKSDVHPQLPLNLRFREENMPWDDQGDINLGLVCHCIREPMLMLKEPHKHEDFNQFLFFLGHDMADMTDFDAEIELFLGEEGEKYVITEATIVRIPPGLYHGPLNFKRIGKPVAFFDIFLAPEYKRIYPSKT
jgi:hypothetical protein